MRADAGVKGRGKGEGERQQCNEKEEKMDLKKASNAGEFRFLCKETLEHLHCLIEAYRSRDYEQETKKKKTTTIRETPFV